MTAGLISPVTVGRSEQLAALREIFDRVCGRLHHAADGVAENDPARPRVLAALAEQLMDAPATASTTRRRRAADRLTITPALASEHPGS